MNKEQYLSIKDTYKSKRRKDINNRKCFNCGSSETRTGFSHGVPYKVWRRIEDDWYCINCFERLTLTKEDRKKKNRNQMKYKDKRVRIKDIRIGKCSWCKNNTKDGSCNQTHKHHFKYNDHDPEKDTFELCDSCHGKVTRQEEKENKIFLEFQNEELRKEIQSLKSRIKQLETK